MCPETSPEKSACSSRIFALTRECPAFHQSGLPPYLSIVSGRAIELLTSHIATAPGCFGSISVQKSAISLSPHITSPRSSTTPILSASPSKPTPKSAPVSRTVSMSFGRFSRFVGSGWWFGKLPSGSL